MPSQQSSLMGRRTVLMPQEAIAATEAASVGPEKIPQPWMQAYSVPERLTPRRRTVWLLPLRSLLPETCRPLMEGLAAAVEPGMRPGRGKEVSTTRTARWRAMITRKERKRGDIANNPP